MMASAASETAPSTAQSAEEKHEEKSSARPKPRSARYRPIPHSKISALHFGIISGEEVYHRAVVEVVNKNQMQEGLPVPGGTNDSNMGTTDSKWKCSHCRNEKPDCPGHFGYIYAKYPVKTPGWADIALQYAKVICFECGAFLLGNRRITGVKRSKLLAEYVKRAAVKVKQKETGKQVKQNIACPECGAKHPHVAPDPKYVSIARNAVLKQTMYDDTGHETDTPLFNHKLVEAFNRVSDETVAILGKPQGSHPRNLISQYIAAPSNILRPDKHVVSGNRSSNDDLTIFMRHIVEKNAALPDVIPDVIDTKQAEQYAALEILYYNMHLSSAASNAARQISNSTSNLDGVAGRWPLKRGRFRKDLMGGRVFYMARSVVSGDPRLPLHIVGLPFFIAKKLHREVVVSEHNYAEMMGYFKNGAAHYPGARHVVKKSTGTRHAIKLLPADAVLEYGDILMRDLIDGDVVMLGRQPSLWDLNLRCFKVRVMFEAETIRFNPCVCVYFNADYDGDEMNITAPTHEGACIEIEALAGASDTGTTHQRGGNIKGLFQNSLWAAAKLTGTDPAGRGVRMAREQMMDIAAMVPDRVLLDPGKQTYTGHEAVSFLIPAGINLRASADQMGAASKNVVEIKNGQMLSGVLDKDVVGQKGAGKLFHRITTMYGARRSNAVIFSMQQLADAFIAKFGSTIHLNDFLLSDEAKRAVDCQTAMVIKKSILFHDEYRKGRLIAPLNMTVPDFHELQQIELLQLNNHKPIISMDFGARDNNLKHANEKCGKGDPNNTMALVSAVGQRTIRGERFGRAGRGSPYYPYHSSDPRSYGFIESSFSQSLNVPEVMAMAEDVRYGLIQIQLSTSTTGQANREMIKSLELITIDAHRRVMKQNQFIVQSLYGHMGLDCRWTIRTHLGYAMISDAAFEAEYRANAAELGYTGSAEVGTALDDEWRALNLDRAHFRRAMLHVESEYMQPRLMSGNITVGFDLDMLLADLPREGSEGKGKDLDPVDAIATLRQFCADLPYVFSNRFQLERRTRVPFQHAVAANAACMVLRDRLCVKKLARRGISNKQLQVILGRVFAAYKQALADPGLAVGVIASQALGEMYTQFMLDSKHRKGTNIADKLRGLEIIYARKTASMANPQMLLHVRPEFRANKQKVAEIAARLEITRFEQFVSRGYVFGNERFGAPEHALLKSQTGYIAAMKKYQDVQVPSDLTSWLILFELNIDRMIQHSIEISTLVHVLNKLSAQIFVVASPESSLNQSIACYVRAGALGKGVEKLEETIRSTVIRGVDGIISAEVVDFKRSVIGADGDIKVESIYAIHTRGTNLRKMLLIEELDANLCQTNSIHETAEVLGIVAGYRKLITEMRVSFDGPAFAHYTVLASEMTFTGEITGMTKAGANLRDNDVLPRASHVSPLAVLTDAAINGVSNKVRGASASLILGAEINDIGTSSSKIIIDEDAAFAAQQSIEDLL